MSRTFRINKDTDSRRNYATDNIKNAWRSESRNSAKERKLNKKMHSKARRQFQLTNEESKARKTRLNTVAYYW